MGHLVLKLRVTWMTGVTGWAGVESFRTDRPCGRQVRRPILRRGGRPWGCAFS